MANPTSGFQLSALPQPLSMPSNLGKFDVGETQQAYANALKNTQQTALLGPQTQAAIAQAGFQTDLAREGIKRLPAETQKLLAQYGADALTAEKSAATSKAQMPYVTSTVTNQAKADEIASRINASIAGQTEETNIATGVSNAEAAAKFADLSAKSRGGVPQTTINIAGQQYPVFYTQNRTANFGPAATLAAKAVKGEVVRHLERKTDDSGQVTVKVKRSLVHGNGTETEKSTEEYAEGHEPKEGFYANPDYSESQQTETSLPQAEKLRGLFAPSQQSTAPVSAAPAAPVPAPVTQTQPVNASEQIASQGVPTSLTPNEDYFSRNLRTPIGLDKAQQVLGRQFSGMQPDSNIPSTGLKSLGTFSQTAPQMGTNAAGQTLASTSSPIPQPLATPVATPSETSTAAVPSMKELEQNKESTPEVKQPKKEQVVIPWKKNTVVAIDDPSAEALKIFEAYAKKQEANPAPLNPRAVANNEKAAKEIRKEYKEVDSQLNALYEVARTAEQLQKKFGFGWMQSKINPDILAQFGLPEGQSFNSAVNALIQNLSDKTQFRNFGVVDLIRQSKPTDKDNPEEILRKIDYLNFMIKRSKDTNEALRAGLINYKMPVQLAEKAVDDSFNVGNRETYEYWKKNISIYSSPRESKEQLIGAQKWIEENKNDPNPKIQQKVEEVRAKLQANLNKK
jgi:hypothetical protein